MPGTCAFLRIKARVRRALTRDPSVLLRHYAFEPGGGTSPP